MTDAHQYSHNRLSAYANCPYKFRRRFIDKVPSVGSDAMTFGTFVHDKIEKHLAHDAPLTNDFAGPYESFLRAERILGDFSKRLADLRTKADLKILSVESSFEIPLDAALPSSGSQRTLRGRIDLHAEAYGKRIVVDWKTSRLLQSRAETEDDLQLHLYGLATPEAEEGWLWNLEHDVVVRVPYDRDKVAAVRRYAIALADEIEAARDFPRKPNPFCATCQFAGECYDVGAPLPLPGGAGVLAVPVPVPTDITPDAVRQVWNGITTVKAHLKVWEKRVDDARAALAVVVAERGAVPLAGDKVLDLRTRERKRYPLDGAYRLLGDDLKGCVEVKNGLLEKRLKEMKASDPTRVREIELGLSAIVEIDSTTELTAIKKPKEEKS